MRRIASIAATTCFAVGFVWQYGGWFLEWVGRALGVRGLTTTYDAFVGGFMTAVKVHYDPKRPNIAVLRPDRVTSLRPFLVIGPAAVMYVLFIISPLFVGR